ncbi:hypothetical protein YC2023_035336 [Brassica napus]
MSILQRIYQHDLTTYPCNPKVHNALIVGFGDSEGRHYWIIGPSTDEVALAIEWYEIYSTPNKL